MGLNTYFAEMARRGYRIRIYQTDYVDFCHPLGSDAFNAIENCVRHPLESLSSLHVLPMNAAAKAKFIAGMYSRLSFALNELRESYLRWASGGSGESAAVGAGRLKLPRTSPIAAMQLFQRFEQDIEHLEPGQMYFVHLMLPHFPYGFDEECRLLPRPYDWPDHTVRLAEDLAASRQKLYGHYLAQVACTMKLLEQLFERMDAAGLFDGTKIIVHGDHGARVFRGKFGLPLESAEVDGHSTLFAFHDAEPLAVASYRRELLPINSLLPEVLQIEGARLSDTWTGEPVVMGRHKLRPMPDFESGKKTR